LKNKGVTYLLLAAVCLIWGIVIYRLISGMSDDETIDFAQSNEKFVDLDSVSETYSLIASYRDPFIGKSTIVKTNTTPRTVVKIAKPVVPVPGIIPKPVIYIDWSFIQYQGLISNKGKAKLIGLVKIKGEDHMVSVNSTIKDVKITFLNKDSVGVIFQGQNRMIGR